MEPVLVLKDVCKNYPGFTLDHVSFEVPRGSIMGFIGEMCIRDRHGTDALIR